MAIYVDRDIATNFSGDLEIDQKGDIKLAQSLQTYKSAANFILRTDQGDYAPDPSVGSDLGTYIGKNNTRSIHEHMEYSIFRAVSNNVFSNTDVTADVVPLDINEALCIVNLAGVFLISGQLITVTNDKIVYSFPYIDGEPTPLTI